MVMGEVGRNRRGRRREGEIQKERERLRFVYLCLALKEGIPVMKNVRDLMLIHYRERWNKDCYLSE
jgi:hypothetical protein